MRKEIRKHYASKHIFKKFVILTAVCCTLGVSSHQNARAEETKTTSFCVYDVKSGTSQQKPLFLKSGISNAELEPEEAQNIGARKQLTEEEKEQFANAIPDTEEEQNFISPLSAGLTPVANTSIFPYCSVCRLLINFPNDNNTYLSTGFAVGKKLCAVARHSITDKNFNFPSRIVAYYGYYNNTYTYKAEDSIEYIYAQDYSSNGPLYDYAFIVWSNTSTSNTGCFGMADKPQTSITAHTIGYPADKGFNGEIPYQSTGQITNSTPENIYFNMDFISGQSGSPVYIDEGNGPFAIGNATHGTTGYDYNFGRRYTNTLISWLVQYGYA